MLEKKKLCQQAGKRLILLYPKDKTRLDDTLAPKLAEIGRGGLSPTTP